MIIKTLKDVLKKTWESTQDVDNRPKAGSSFSDRPMSSKDALNLKIELENALRRNKPILWLALFFMVISFFSMIYILFNIETIAGIKELVVSTNGGIFAFFLTWSFKIWREINSLQMLIPVATIVQGEALTSLIRILSENSKSTWI